MTDSLHKQREPHSEDQRDKRERRPENRYRHPITPQGPTDVRYRPHLPPTHKVCTIWLVSKYAINLHADKRTLKIEGKTAVFHAELAPSARSLDRLAFPGCEEPVDPAC
jgi:hypothetical protein